MARATRNTLHTTFVVVLTVSLTLVVTRVWANDGSNVVSATELRVVDQGGVVRISMGVQDGQVQISLFSEEGNLGCQLFVRDADNSSGLAVLNQGKPAIDVFQRCYGPPRNDRSPSMPAAEAFGGLIAYDGDGAKRITMTHSGSSAMLVLAGAEGGAHASAGVKLSVEDSTAEVQGWSGGDASFDKETQRVLLRVPGEQQAPHIEVADKGEIISRMPGE